MYQLQFRKWDPGLLAFEFAHEGLAYCEDRVIRRANAAFTEIFRIQREEAEGLALDQIYPSIEDSINRVRVWTTAFIEAGYYADERAMIRRNGEIFWCGVRGRSLNPQSPFSQTVLSFTDLTVCWDASGLSPRERQIGLLLREGYTAKRIARRLDLSFRSVESCLARMRKKLGVHNAVELVGRLYTLTLGSGTPDGRDLIESINATGS